MNEIHFEGRVTEVFEDSFGADLFEVGTNNREWAVIIIDKIPENQRAYIAEGAVFDWKISEDSFTFVFKEPIFWTQEMLDEAKQKAEEICKKLGWANNERI